MRLVLLAALVVGIAASLATEAPAQPTTGTAHTIDATSLGGLHVSGSTPTFEQAVAHFRSLTTGADSRFIKGGCVLTFAGLGVKLFLVRLDTGIKLGTPATCRFLIAAVVTSRAWRTSHGLQVGSTVQTLHRLYPSARSGPLTEKGGILGPPHSTEWVLADPTPGHASHPVLVARVRRTRVVALGISIFGH